ncbi:NTP transferase domain-containing protein [Pseudomonadales bacterium]|nr:NTP transferase domain-containing protein [Pseudomonadales bacterium]
MDKSQRKITGLILCGGKGTRLGNKDKGLVPYRGKMLVQHMIDRVKPQVDQLLININQNENEYETFGAPLTTDADNNYRGPLAGVLSAKSKITTEFCFVVPCDATHTTEHSRKITHRYRRQTRSCRRESGKSTTFGFVNQILDNRNYRQQTQG